MNWYKKAEADGKLHGEFNSREELLQYIENLGDSKKLDDLAKRYQDLHVHRYILVNPSTWSSTWNWVAQNMDHSKSSMLQIARSTKATTETLEYIAKIALQHDSEDLAPRVFIELIDNPKTDTDTLDWIFAHMRGMRLLGAVNEGALRPYALEAAAISKNPNLSTQILKEVIAYFGEANRAQLIPQRAPQDRVVMRAVAKHPAITKELLKAVLQTNLISRLPIYQQALKITRSQLL
jgi:hypothetical protein